MQMLICLFYASVEIQVYLNFSDLLEETWTMIHETITLSNDPKKSSMQI